MQKSKRVTEDWKRLAVRQHYRIGQLQGGFKPSVVDHSVRTINKTGAAKGIMRLPHRWEHVLHNCGEYVEGLWKYELCRCAVSKVTAVLSKLKFQPSYFKLNTKYTWSTECLNSKAGPDRRCLTFLSSLQFWGYRTHTAHTITCLTRGDNMHDDLWGKQIA